MIHPPASTLPSGFASHALQLVQKVQRGISPIELVYMSHEHWPTRPEQTIHNRPTLRISVLDSSYNPPTLAHLALANSASAQPHDAGLLLLSVRNADKVMKPGDATFVQRLEMMRLLSQDIRSTDNAVLSGNVAVAIIDEPTFVGKSTLLLRFLRTRLAAFINIPSHPSSVPVNVDAPRPIPSPKLTFLLGFDTLVRLFSPKYYPSEQVMIQMLQSFLSPDQEDCCIVCARRRSPGADKTFQDKASEVVHEFITSKRIGLIDIGADEQTYSSSEVRAKVAAGDGTWKRLVTSTIADYITEQGIYSYSP